VSAQEIKKKGCDLTGRNPNRPEGGALPSPAEMVAGLLERERETLSIMEESPEGGHEARALGHSKLPGMGPSISLFGIYIPLDINSQVKWLPR
jgi:hypothetical protein